MCVPKAIYAVYSIWPPFMAACSVNLEEFRVLMGCHNPYEICMSSTGYYCSSVYPVLMRPARRAEGSRSSVHCLCWLYVASLGSGKCDHSIMSLHFIFFDKTVQKELVSFSKA